MQLRPPFLSLACSASVMAATPHGIDYTNLPNDTVFPGPWDEYIKAPVNKSFITPTSIWKVNGNVTTTSALGLGKPPGDGSILIGEGGLLTLEFAENIAGRVCFDLESSTGEPVVNIAYSESSFFAGKLTDATNDEEWDLPLEFHVGNRTGPMCVGPDFIRGGFKYLTLWIDDIPVFGKDGSSTLNRGLEPGIGTAQKVIGTKEDDHQSVLEEKRPYSQPSIGLAQLWVNCTSFPSQSNGRAYSGYFYSSSKLLNRIFYAGAYTLQLSTIDPREGSALIPVNRFLDHNKSPRGSWYSNFTVSAGTTVTTDGAKRDRLCWPGDMYIAIPGIAVSTYDMLAIRNALDVIYQRQYSDGRLPYAGPPLSYQNEFSDTYHLHALLGTYFYVLYSGDIAWLSEKWPAYLRAVRVSTSKIDSKNLMHVTSPFDWNRHGMGGHNLEATAILHEVLKRSTELASFLIDDDSQEGLLNSTQNRPDTASWYAFRQRLQRGIESLYCNQTGLYADNLDDRHCLGHDHVDPQDGNSWALIAGMQAQSSTTTPLAVSQGLRRRWNKFGAPAPEFPNVMSPFASSFELQAHCAAHNHDAAVELMLLMWGYLLDGPGFTNSTLAEGFRTDGYVHYPAYPFPSRNSHAHGWAAGPTSVLMTGILGIELTKPGGSEWTIRPVITGWLGWVRGGFAVQTSVFEVEMRRALLSDGKVTKKGVVAVIKAPQGSHGQFGWGDESADDSFRADVVGGETRAWVRWERGNMTEELDVTNSNLGSRSDERWFEERIPYNGTELEYDYTFEEPVMQEREAGVVDFEALERGYVKPWNWMGEEVGELRV